MDHYFKCCQGEISTHEARLEFLNCQWPPNGLVGWEQVQLQQIFQSKVEDRQRHSSWPMAGDYKDRAARASGAAARWTFCAVWIMVSSTSAREEGAEACGIPNSQATSLRSGGIVAGIALAVDEMSTEWGNNLTTSDNAVMGEIGEGGCSSLLADMKNWSRETLDGDAAGAGNCQQHRYLTEKGVVSLLTVILERAAPTGQTPTETTIFASWNFIRAALYSNRPNYSLSLQCSNGGFFNRRLNCEETRRAPQILLQARSRKALRVSCRRSTVWIPTMKLVQVHLGRRGLVRTPPSSKSRDGSRQVKSCVSRSAIPPPSLWARDKGGTSPRSSVLPPRARSKGVTMTDSSGNEYCSGGTARDAAPASAARGDRGGTVSAGGIITASSDRGTRGKRASPTTSSTTAGTLIMVTVPVPVVAQALPGCAERVPVC